MGPGPSGLPAQLLNKPVAWPSRWCIVQRPRSRPFPLAHAPGGLGWPSLPSLLVWPGSEQSVGGYLFMLLAPTDGRQSRPQLVRSSPCLGVALPCRVSRDPYCWGLSLTSVPVRVPAASSCLTVPAEDGRPPSLGTLCSPGLCGCDGHAWAKVSHREPSPRVGRHRSQGAGRRV